MSNEMADPTRDGAAAQAGEAASPAEGPRARTEEEILDVLRTVFDPEIHMNIVDLGLVYVVKPRGTTVLIDMTLTTPGCPYGPYLLHLVRESLLAMEGVDEVDLNVVWDPPWSPEKMSEEARLEFGFEV